MGMSNTKKNAEMKAQVKLNLTEEIYYLLSTFCGQCDYRL